MAIVQTLYGTFSEEQMKMLKGAIDEMELVMHKQDALKEEMKDILDTTFDAMKIPKKIIRRMVRVQYKQSFHEEVAASKEFEALFEGMTEAN